MSRMVKEHGKDLKGLVTVSEYIFVNQLYRSSKSKTSASNLTLTRKLLPTGHMSLPLPTKEFKA